MQIAIWLALSGCLPQVESPDDVVKVDIDGDGWL